MTRADAVRGRRRAGPPRVLMLAAGDPSEDPRIGWAAQTAATLADTHVLGTVWEPTDEYRTYEGDVYVERLSVLLHASRTSIDRYMALARLNTKRRVVELVAREGRPPSVPAVGTAARRTASTVHARAAHGRATFDRFVAGWGYYSTIAGALTRRTLGESIAPTVLVALDLYALLACVRLKRRLGSRLIYDCHELWPWADLMASPWEQRAVKRLERTLVGHADSVITVSPMIAEMLEDMYGLRNVLTVPNAAPVEEGIAPSSERPLGNPVRCLLQGNAGPGRGIDVLLEAWRGVDPAVAILVVRCPQSTYLETLRRRFDALVRLGSVRFVDPVPPDRLIQAATGADIGIIPYVGPNPNHVYCCPNKLSQYMQAGLAVLTNDLPFVREIVERNGVGAIYDADRPETLAEQVHGLAADPHALSAMKARSRAAAVDDYNWAHVSRAYEAAIADALRAAKTAT